MLSLIVGFVVQDDEAMQSGILLVEMAHQVCPPRADSGFLSSCIPPGAGDTGHTWSPSSAVQPASVGSTCTLSTGELSLCYLTLTLRVPIACYSSFL